jgi:hypothetical protein
MEEKVVPIVTMSFPQNEKASMALIHANTYMPILVPQHRAAARCPLLSHDRLNDESRDIENHGADHEQELPGCSGLFLKRWFLGDCFALLRLSSPEVRMRWFPF